jgi:hypothetical protein
MKTKCGHFISKDAFFTWPIGCNWFEASPPSLEMAKGRIKAPKLGTDTSMYSSKDKKISPCVAVDTTVKLYHVNTKSAS